ncbi:hypothetical protein BC828DRAFT_383160 [Blastocladiella britannica]|nr:hypothetical protein BC828DRAFT_383160 [Blastocladiella britannica]
MAFEAGPASNERYMKAMALREALADDILSTQEMLTELESRRAANREALGSLLPHRPAAASSSPTARSRSPPPMHPVAKADARNRVWLNLGDMFIKVNRSVAAELLAKDQKTMEAEITGAKAQIRGQVQQLHEIDAQVTEQGQAYNVDMA